MSARENIAKNIVHQLENMTTPAPNFVTREHFDVQKLAITQYPAILVYTANEDREDISTDERQSNITFQLRCFVRGNQLDTQRNELCENISETLEKSRDRDLTLAHENIHNVSTTISNVEVIERELPLAQMNINVNVRYTYTKGVL